MRKAASAGCTREVMDGRALVRPDRAAMRAIGRNVLDISRWAVAATAGRAQAAAKAAAVQAVWRAD